jgi:hypothetical protein
MDLRKIPVTRTERAAEAPLRYSCGHVHTSYCPLDWTDGQVRAHIRRYQKMPCTRCQSYQDR